MKNYSLLFVALLALGACKDKKEESSDAPKAGKAGEVDKGADKGADKAPAAGKVAPIKLGDLGLMIDAPSGIEQSDMAGSIMLQAPGFAMSVSATSEFDAQTFAEVDGDLEMYTPLNVVKTEVENGWDIVFENKGSMGTNYWVSSRRIIDGKHYNCGTTASNKEQQATALAACKTLRKAE